MLLDRVCWCLMHIKYSIKILIVVSLLLWPQTAVTRSFLSKFDKEYSESAIDVGLKIYERYFGADTAEKPPSNICLLGRAQDFLWWLNDDCHVKSVFGIASSTVLDVAHSNWTEKEANEYLETRELFDTRFKQKIVIMSLAYNRFTKIPFDFLLAFKDEVELLTLSGNPIAQIMTKSIKVGSIGIGGPKAVGFPPMKQLVELDMRHCHLQSIDSNSFQDLKLLRRLFLAHNQIATITSSAFNGLNQLKHLDLSFNSVLEDKAAIRFGKFDAYWNMLNGLALHKDIFSELSQLIFLDLSHTKLQAYSGVALAYLGDNLEQLSICYTQIPVITEGMFQNTNLKVLDLSGNPTLVTTFTPEALSGLEDRLEILRFDNSYLKYISWIANLKRLKVVLMSNNTINEIPEEALPKLKYLTILDLSQNHLSHWYYRLMNNISLKVLDLRHNNINVISKEMIADLKNVEFVAIGQNNFLCNCLLREFLEIVVKNTEELNCPDDEGVGIDSNAKIPQLSIGSEYDTYGRVLKMYLDEMNNAKEIILSLPSIPKLAQPADGRTSTTKSWKIKEFLDKIRSKVIGSDVYCNHTSRRKRSIIDMEKEERNETSFMMKVQLLDYSDEDYRCINSNSTVAYYIAELEECTDNRVIQIPPEDDSLPFSYIILMPILTLLTIMIVVFVYYFRGYDIRYFCITFRNVTILSLMDKEKRKLLRRKSTLIEDQFNYDVFVSYSDQNRKWVLDELLPNIEHPDEMTVCLHERDFKVGLTILENIINCMDQSRSILLVISKSFVSSNWCQFELHLAQHRLLETRREQLIIVLLENIPQISRPRTLQYLMRTKTYLEWPEAKPAKFKNGKLKFHNTDILYEQRKVFWQRLKEAIKEKQI